MMAGCSAVAAAAVLSASTDCSLAAATRRCRCCCVAHRCRGSCTHDGRAARRGWMQKRAGRNERAAGGRAAGGGGRQECCSCSPGRGRDPGLPPIAAWRLPGRSCSGRRWPRSPAGPVRGRHIVEAQASSLGRPLQRPRTNPAHIQAGQGAASALQGRQKLQHVLAAGSQALCAMMTGCRLDVAGMSGGSRDAAQQEFWRRRRRSVRFAEAAPPPRAFCLLPLASASMPATTAMPAAFCRIGWFNR